MSRPRKAPAHHLEGAPPYVLAVYDDGPKVNDRYTVLFGWPIWQPEAGIAIPSLSFNECPSSPNMGISLWGEACGRWGARMISWKDLPERLQRHVISRANYPDKVKVATLEWDPEHRWLLLSDDGIGGFGPDFRTKGEAKSYAASNDIILMDH